MSSGAEGRHDDSCHSKDPNCKSNLSRVIQYVAAANEVAAEGEGGFVKGVVTYLVMNDLVAIPMSTIFWDYHAEQI
ncbi:hypothetical protein Vadar_013322 [Vaccinium darrowii]|uniref:Uncharacterized protein n=1 Tax=Vaccinium darrowii TaxID=229202 RepID=A0ACB7XIF9_9ERIC|nr:hypothetical protein Vadar_013322 [Vaccinium darrowii]